MLNAVVARLVGFLPSRLQPYAKAIVPAVLVLLSVLVQAFINGEYDPTAVDAAIRGVGVAFLTFLIPNIAR